MIIKVFNCINNKEIITNDATFFNKTSPLNNKIIAEVYRSKRNDIEDAVEAAGASFSNWSIKSPVERGNVIYSIVEEMIRCKREIAEVIFLETGKSMKDALQEVEAAISQGRFMAGEGTRLGGRYIPCSSPQKKVITSREPVGIIGLLVSFNTPIANITWKVFPALICGNTIVLKSSEHTPLTANKFAEICHRSGLDPGVLNIVHGLGSECGHELINHPAINLVSFTGSTKVGKTISESLAGKLSKVFLELGGKNAMVICSDADQEKALDWVIQSSFSNAGQRCASSSRIVVEESIYEEFRKKLIYKTEKLLIGSKDTDNIGPVISSTQVEKLIYWSKQGVEEGGRLLTGGKKDLSGENGLGNYFQPTILENISIESNLSKNELFGPFTILYKFKKLEDAINICNATNYGLTACIHTSNFNNAMEFCSKVQVGVVTVNGGTHGSEPHIPFGGVKDSGNGFREPGMEALEIYSNWKNIVLNY